MSIRKWSKALVAALVTSSLLGWSGCDEDEPETIVECGDSCDGDLGAGNASITGHGSMDGFFQSVLTFEATCATVAGAIELQLDGLRADFGLDGISDADLATQLTAKLRANLQGDLAIKVEEPRCVVDAELARRAQARCEVEAHCFADAPLGSAKLECSGSCEVEASATASCGAGADLTCTFLPPDLSCTGVCKGSCKLNAGARCEGTCTGACSGVCKGTCRGSTDESGRCDGTCSGTCEGACEGACELNVAAECDGSCSGECTVKNPEGGCEGGIRASCDAKAGSAIACDGRCDGEVTPPSASANEDCASRASCEASTSASASLMAECSSPAIEIDYLLGASLAGEANALARAQFEAALKNLRTRIPALLASLKKSDIALETGKSLSSSATGAVMDSVEPLVASDVAFPVLFKLSMCAADELARVPDMVEGAATGLEAQVSTALAVTAAVGL